MIVYYLIGVSISLVAGIVDVKNKEGFVAVEAALSCAAASLLSWITVVIYTVYWIKENKHTRLF